MIITWEELPAAKLAGFWHSGPKGSRDSQDASLWDIQSYLTSTETGDSRRAVWQSCAVLLRCRPKVGFKACHRCQWLEAKNGRAPQQALAEYSLHDCTQKQLHTIAFREKLEGEVGSGSDAYKFENRWKYNDWNAAWCASSCNITWRSVEPTRLGLSQKWLELETQLDQDLKEAHSRGTNWLSCLREIREKTTPQIGTRRKDDFIFEFSLSIFYDLFDLLFSYIFLVSLESSCREN